MPKTVGSRRVKDVLSDDTPSIPVADLSPPSLNNFDISVDGDGGINFGESITIIGNVIGDVAVVSSTATNKVDGDFPSTVLLTQKPSKTTYFSSSDDEDCVIIDHHDSSHSEPSCPDPLSFSSSDDESQSKFSYQEDNPAKASINSPQFGPILSKNPTPKLFTDNPKPHSSTDESFRPLLSISTFSKQAPKQTIPNQCPFPECLRIFSQSSQLDAHLNSHLKNGQSPGNPWLSLHKRNICLHCKLIVSTLSPGNYLPRHGYVHGKKCKPTFLASFRLNPAVELSPSTKSNQFTYRLKQVPDSLAAVAQIQSSQSSSENSSSQAQPYGNPSQSQSSGLFPPNVLSPVNQDLLMEIFSTDIPTRAFVPFTCLHLLAQAFNFATKEIFTKKDISSWCQLFALFKCTLYTTPGEQNIKKRNNNFASIIKSRLNSFMAGNWINLWEQAKRTLSSIKISNPKRDWKKMVISTAERGNLSSAFRLINSSGLAPINQDTIRILKELHPADPKHFAPPFDPSISNPIFIDQTLMTKCIKSFPNGTAPGPDGLRAQHLIDLLRANPEKSPHDIRPSLAQLISIFASGEAPIFLAPLFASSKLIPLIKPKDQSIRPIAIGCIYRRLTSKILLSLISEKASNLLFPFQLGVGMKCGSEIITHLVRLFQKSNQENEKFVFLSVDCSNAFNQCSRSKFYEKVKSDFPQLLPLVSYCYSNSPHLFISKGLNFGTAKIPSLNGTQQGDPLGPLLFCLALQPLIEKISTIKPKLDLNTWYLDDGILGGNTESISEAAQILINDGPDFGIFLNTSKTQLYWPSRSFFDNDNLDPDFQRAEHGFKCLGIPIGNDEYVKSDFQLRIDKCEYLMKRITQLNSTQISFALLSKCLSFCKIGYFLRCTPNTMSRFISLPFDSVLRSCLESLFGIHLNNLTLTQVQIPYNLGGLGLRSTFQHSSASFLSSINSCEPNILKLISDSMNMKPILHSEKLIAQKELTKILSPQIPNEHTFNSKSQKVISTLIDKKNFTQLFESSSSKSKARINACIGKQGSLVFNAPLSAARGFKLSPQEFNSFISSRMGLANLCEEDEICPLCNTLMDKEGYHMAVCKRGGSTIQRHNSIRDIIFEHCQKASWNPKLEIACINNSNNNSIPADIYIPKSPPIALDVTVVHPLADKYLNKSSKISDGANILAELGKNQKYQQICKDSNVKFIPLSLEFYGRWGPDSKSFFQTLSNGISNRFGGNSKSILRELHRKLLFSLIKSNASAVAIRTPSMFI